MDKQLKKLLQTSAVDECLRKLRIDERVSSEVVSAAKYYMGVPDGRFFEAKDFDDSVVNAKKAYVTLNTIMGGPTSERDRFNEGKKQVPNLLTPRCKEDDRLIYTFILLCHS